MISPDVKRTIDEEAQALNPKDYRSTTLSAQGILRSYSGLMYQVKKDKVPLVESGFEWERMPKYEGYLTVLADVNAERVITVPSSPEEKKDFDRRMEAAEIVRRKLRMVVSHIIDVTDSDELRTAYRLIAEKSGQVDTLQDNRSYIGIIRRYPEIARELKPGGVEMTSDILDEIYKEADALLSVLGADDHPRNEAVDLQNRIITLCLNAQTYIKKYARAAFVDDPEYYNRYYADKSAKSPVSEPQEKETETV